MRFLLVFARTLVGLALSLWIGGLAFFGAITAAIMFPMTKAAGAPALAPQMVGPMLSRFGWVCVAASLFLLAGWLLDAVVVRPSRTWKIQGSLTLVAIALGAYLNFALLPQTIREQPAVLPLYVKAARNQMLSPSESVTKAHFDAGHHLYNRLAGINLWLLVGVLVCLMARASENSIFRSSSIPT